MATRDKSKDPWYSQADFGFGSKMVDRDHRLINPDGTFNIIRKGRGGLQIYDWLITTTWWQYLLTTFLLFLMVNFFYALCLLLIGVDQLAGVANGHFWLDLREAFFFSVQTFTTVGYGVIIPQGHAANWLAGFIAFSGFSTFSFFAGLTFARFSKPVKRITFSKNALINDEQGVKTLQFRLVNQDKNNLFDLEAMVVVTWLADDLGRLRRKFERIVLVKEKIILFPINWTPIHIIDDKSPLYKLSKEQIAAQKTEIMVVVRGYDELYTQLIHSYHSYYYKDIVWNARFRLMYDTQKEGTVLHLDQLNDYELLDDKKNDEQV